MENKGVKYHTASFIMWEPMHEHIFGNTMDFNKLYSRFDDGIAISAANYINTPELDVLFLNFDHIDHAGHWYGYGPLKYKYIKAIEKVDKYIGGVIDSLKKRPLIQNEDWLIIITSDHGGIKHGHGGQTIEEKQIPIILSGTKVKKEPIKKQIYLTDFVPTLLKHFGIKRTQNGI